MIAASVVTWLMFESDMKCGAWNATTRQSRTMTPERVSSRERPTALAARAATPRPAGPAASSADIGRLA